MPDPRSSKLPRPGSSQPAFPPAGLRITGLFIFGFRPLEALPTPFNGINLVALPGFATVRVATEEKLQVRPLPPGVPGIKSDLIMQATLENTANPIQDLVTDDIFQVLDEHDLLSEKGIRDYTIRQKFRTLRTREVPAFDAIERLREEYPYLQFDTIRKIVYKMGGRH